MLIGRDRRDGIHRVTLGFTACLTALGAAAHAQSVTVTGLTQNPLPVTVGQEAFFYGTVTNTDVANPVTLGALSVDFIGNSGGDGSYMTQDLNDYYVSNVLDTLTLAPANQTGDAYTGELFGIMTDADPTTDTPPGAYDEAFTLSDVDGDPLAVSGVTVSVAAPAPEPASLLTFAVGVALMTGLATRRRMTKPPNA